jgi:uncharacterized protein YceH (UPF0502 family)
MKKQTVLAILALTALLAFAQNKAAPKPAGVQAKYEARIGALEEKVSYLELRISRLEERASQTRGITVNAASPAYR